MTNPASDIDRWLEKARGLESAYVKLSVPLHVLLGEAVDLAKFHKTYWPTKREDGKIVLLGLETAVKPSTKEMLHPRTHDELLSLERACHELHTRFLLTSELTPESPIERARDVLVELRSTLEFALDDGVTDDDDARLAAIEKAHPDPLSADAIALALEAYAGLADTMRDELDGLGGFSASTIDEARELAAALRDRPQNPREKSPEARAALELRDRFLLLLVERMAVVREAARFVYRKKPEIAKLATSAYERRRRLASKRRAKEAQTSA